MATDIMPPVVPLESSEEITDNDDVAFQVLNQDNLAETPMKIIGESILKPFGRELNQKQKPNIIVYPTRRLINNDTTNLQEIRPFTQSSDGCLNQILNHTNYNLKRNKWSISHDENLNSSKFLKNVEIKLKKLQKCDIFNVKKPPFITTVKQGEFLEPPPEIANLIGLKLADDLFITNHHYHHHPKPIKQFGTLYAYSSKPRILNRFPVKSHLHKIKCENNYNNNVGVVEARKEFTDINSNNYYNNRKTDSTGPYANVMVEKRVCRGSNYAALISGHLGDGESTAARAAEARRRALARRKAKSQQIRAAQLRLGSPPPVSGRKHEPVQLEKYLEEIYDHPPVEDRCTQSDLFLERPISPVYVPMKRGEDVETQIWPGELFDFDMEVQPILEVLVGKTIEQALIEVLEEEELATLREQQRRFLEMRAVELSEAQRLEEREKRFMDEKNRRLKEFEEGAKIQKELEERIAASVLMQGYIAELLPSVLEGLEADGVISDNIKQDIDESFVPWLMKEVTNEIKEMVSSRDVLADIVQEILENRAEIYAALNREPKEEEVEEEQPTHQDDIILEDHLKLTTEIAANLGLY